MESPPKGLSLGDLLRWYAAKMDQAIELATAYEDRYNMVAEIAGVVDGTLPTVTRKANGAAPIHHTLTSLPEPGPLEEPVLTRAPRPLTMHHKPLVVGSKAYQCLSELKAIVDGATSGELEERIGDVSQINSALKTLRVRGDISFNGTRKSPNRKIRTDVWKITPKGRTTVKEAVVDPAALARGKHAATLAKYAITKRLEDAANS